MSGGDARLAAELALEEARKSKDMLTRLRRTRRSSKYSRLVKGRTRVAVIPRRSCERRQVVLVAVGGDAVDHEKPNGGLG